MLANCPRFVCMLAISKRLASNPFSCRPIGRLVHSSSATDFCKPSGHHEDRLLSERHDASGNLRPLALLVSGESGAPHPPLLRPSTSTTRFPYNIKWGLTRPDWPRFQASRLAESFDPTRTAPASCEHLDCMMFAAGFPDVFSSHAFRLQSVFKSGVASWRW